MPCNINVLIIYWHEKTLIEISRLYFHNFDTLVNVRVVIKINKRNKISRLQER